MKTLDSKIPEGPLHEKWDNRKAEYNLVAPNNKKKHNIIVVGTGLAGAASAASLAELGYNVKAFCISDSPRRAHSIAAQGGINATKNYPNDGDSIWRLFYDTIKGGDYRSREANTYRLAQLSSNIIDQAVAQGVPFAREYGGELATRSFGGAQVSRTFYARGQTGQQLLLGAYGALMRQVDEGKCEMFTHREMLDLVVVDGRARGIITRNLWTGEIERHSGDAVVLCTGGYGRVYFLSTNAFNSNGTAAWRCHRRGAFMANPCYVQIHPTCIPSSGHYQSKRTLMSESLRNDGRVWVPKNKADVDKPPHQIPEKDRDYYLERKYPAFGNLVPRDVASRNAKYMVDAGLGVGPQHNAVYLDFSHAIKEQGRDAIKEKYGNLFHMYHKITDENPYEQPMRIFPAVHYVMGGLWVDYNLMSNLPGLFVAGEANFSDHGANRLGASALMQGLADGYFIVSRAVSNYLAENRFEITDVSTDQGEFKEAEKEVRTGIDKLLELNEKAKAKPADQQRTVMDIYRDLGEIMWDKVGIARTGEGLKKALEEIPKLREEFWSGVIIPGDDDTFNKYLEVAGRVADFLELGELMARDALERDESAGCHFREEHQTEKGEALRDDEAYAYVAAWEYQGMNEAEKLHKEPLEFEFVKLKQRSYE
ncbi:fumarate reductase/succinate dehydrogenase flavoprotein subunit [Persicimonas caeni]|uniref:succinate dehydrogenase n=1 Tax=Persicimonas caeni TaxID=2292766 RepID=A0A4Y6PY70_PERCE|nr:fumarate reductase/succinate dehydrogenase flavoprotein subunit [Persicimonas caeni]QDG53256.1 fumarate reductase/succinate dehydrogenase flavoprotein subunit [Persicimonas caeni]QED34478.1 fumarate reductase/succinate dehydrogenase flavoprotein subunit [Persicimonas caeni]